MPTTHPTSDLPFYSVVYETHCWKFEHYVISLRDTAKKKKKNVRTMVNTDLSYFHSFSVLHKRISKVQKLYKQKIQNIDMTVFSRTTSLKN